MHNPAMRTPDRYYWDYPSLSKVSRGVPRSAAGEWTIADLMDLCGASENRLRQCQVRGEFDPFDIASVVPFLARRGPIELRQRLVVFTFSKPGRKSPPPKSLAGLVEWLARFGTVAYRQKILLAALGTERKRRKRTKARPKA